MRDDLLTPILRPVLQPVLRPRVTARAARLALAGLAFGTLAACQDGLAMPNLQMPNLQMPNLSGTLPYDPFGGGSRPASGGGAAGGGVTDAFSGQGMANRVPDGSGLGTGTGPGVVTGAPAPAIPSAPAAAPVAAAATHTVVAGETAYSVARKYGITVQQLAAANGLSESASIRLGQTLTIPARGAAVATVTAPGMGSPTPLPPSASQPLPSGNPPKASDPVKKPENDLGATRTAASSGKLSMPVSGSISRAYKKGVNDGIDISAPAGSTVKAASGGTVAAITKDTDQVPIVVIRHSNGLMTVYANINGVTVKKGDSVSAGQAIGKSRGGPVHFEVRQGFDSVDPSNYL